MSSNTWDDIIRNNEVKLSNGQGENEDFQSLISQRNFT